MAKLYIGVGSIITCSGTIKIATGKRLGIPKDCILVLLGDVSLIDTLASKPSFINPSGDVTPTVICIPGATHVFDGTYDSAKAVYVSDAFKVPETYTYTLFTSNTSVTGLLAV